MREVTLWYNDGIPDYLEVKENDEIVEIFHIDEKGYTSSGENYITMYYLLRDEK